MKANSKYLISDSPLTWRHVWITAVASLGQLIGSGLATLASVIIPLIQITSHPELSSVMQGVIGAADLVGICIGSALFGKLIDSYGYILFFRLCPVIIFVSALVAYLFPSVPVLVVALFTMGIGIGGEYSLDSGYISELMPDKWKFIMVGSAKASSSLGNIIVAAMCVLIIGGWHMASLWPKLLWIVAGISLLMIITRIGFHESPQWLLDKGKTALAEKATHDFLGPDVDIDKDVSSAPAASTKQSMGGFIKGNLRKVVFTGVPWACEGLGVYGIGVFLPILVMALGLESAGSAEAPIRHVASSVEITMWISCIMLPGFIMGLFMINRVNGVRLQSVGFYLSAAALVVLLFSFTGHWNKWISIGAFMAFELFLNMGPHLMTFVLPSRIYPVEDRGMGSGLAASIGKIGAIIGVFVIPLLLDAGGARLVLIVSSVVMVTGGLITDIFRPRSGNG